MERIGRYQILRKLGRGAMGLVYLAQDPSIDRLVAIKTFEVGDSGGEDWQWLRERLLAEGNRAGSLDHPNIVKIYDVVDEGERAYIVMEYVDGPTLEQFLQTHDAPDADFTLEMLRQAATALDYAHSRGIVHRDIKPPNLMIDSKNTLKITDFGIAKRAGAMTQTGRFVGTPEYMAPEQIEARSDIDGRADQFSLATVAYMLITGRKPFEADTVTALSHMIVNKQPTQPSEINHQLNKHVDGVIRKAMSKSPSSRYRSCAEFIEALQAALTAPPRQTPNIWIPLGAAAVLLLTLVGAAIHYGWFDTQDIRKSTPKTDTAQSDVTPVPTPVPTPLPTPTPDPPVADPPPHQGGHKGGDSEPNRNPPPPPPPPVSVEARYALSIYARDAVVAPGSSFREDDTVKGDLGFRELVCLVKPTGSVSKSAKLRLIWYRDGEPADSNDFALPGSTGIKVPYDNKPEPGKYRVQLLVNGKSVKTEASFAILPSSS